MNFLVELCFTRFDELTYRSGIYNTIPNQGVILGKTRAIRFSDREDKLIEEFLLKNPIFDFSSLARAAILEFMGNPKVSVQAVKSNTRIPRKSEVRGQL